MEEGYIIDEEGQDQEYRVDEEGNIIDEGTQGYIVDDEGYVIDEGAQEYLGEIEGSYGDDIEDIEDDIVFYWKSTGMDRISIEEEAELVDSKFRCAHPVCKDGECKCVKVDNLVYMDYILGGRKLHFDNGVFYSKSRADLEPSHEIFAPHYETVHKTEDSVEILIKKGPGMGVVKRHAFLDKSCIRVKILNYAVIFYILYPDTNYVQYAFLTVQHRVDDFHLKYLMGTDNSLTLDYRRIDNYREGIKEYVDETRFKKTKSARK